MEYIVIAVVIASAINLHLFLSLNEKLKISSLKGKLRDKKFWIKIHKNTIKDLEALVVDMKNEIKNLNSTLDALEEGVIEMSDDDDDDDDEDDEEELDGKDYTGIEAEAFDAKVVGH